MDIKQFCIDRGISVEEIGPIGEISDGFHTFDSLYHQRMILFAALVNTFPSIAWKSRKHSNGETPFGGGWFIVGINTPKGPYTYHYEDKYWDIFHCQELEKAPEWDGHTDKDVERLLSLTPKPEKGTMSSWAAQEVELAIQAEKESAEGTDDWKYGAGCYESALRAFQCISRDGHSGYSVQITKSILNRIIDGRCLTPIEDTPDSWEEVFLDDRTHRHYQCRRMSSLFKKVYPDGSVTYSDVDRVNVFDVNDPRVPFTNGFVTGVIDRIFPITMPYFPADKKFKVFREEFAIDSDYNALALLYIITPDGKTVELNRYFKDVDGQLVNIDKAEFDDLKAKRADKK